MINHNGLKRNIKVLKLYIKFLNKLEEAIDKIQNKLDTMDYWNEENRTTRITLYRELEKIIKKFREVRYMVYYYQKKFLKEANLTG